MAFSPDAPPQTALTDAAPRRQQWGASHVSLRYRRQRGRSLAIGTCDSTGDIWRSAHLAVDKKGTRWCRSNLRTWHDCDRRLPLAAFHGMGKPAVFPLAGGDPSFHGVVRISRLLWQAAKRTRQDMGTDSYGS